MIREKHIGISDLGKLTRKQLRELDELIVVHYRKTEPIAVVVPSWMWNRVNLMLGMANDIHNCSGVTEEKK